MLLLMVDDQIIANQSLHFPVGGGFSVFIVPHFNFVYRAVNLN